MEHTVPYKISTFKFKKEDCRVRLYYNTATIWYLLELHHVKVIISHFSRAACGKPNVVQIITQNQNVAY